MRAITRLILAVFLGGCAPRYVIPPDGAYDYRVPVAASKGIEAAFERLMDATAKVTWSPTYRTYHYTHDFTSESGVRLDRPMPDPLSPTGYRLAEVDGIRVTEDAYSKVGAGIVLIRAAVGEGRDASVAITAGHLVTAPDTIKTYMRDQMGRETHILASVSVKVDSFLFISGRTGVNLGATVRRLDVERDLALLTLSIPWEHSVPREFDLRLGRMRDLKWGNFVYVIGYPLGGQRITGGMVSLDTQEGRFNVDAAVRAGYSGGPVIAVRDGLPNFELVGLCRGIATRKERRVVPDGMLSAGTTLSPELLGHLSVEESDVAEYGLGIALSVDEMKAFLHENRDVFTGKGIDVPNETLMRMWGL